MERAARAGQGVRLIKGQGSQASRVDDAQGEARSGSHSGLACRGRMWGLGRISGRLSSEAKCCPGGQPSGARTASLPRGGIRQRTGEPLGYTLKAYEGERGES